MKKVVYALAIVVVTFLTNIGLFYYSDNYSFFLKKMKYWDNVISLDAKNITDIPQNNSGSCNCQNISSGASLTTPSRSPAASNGSWALNLEQQLKELFSLFDKKTLVLQTYDEYYKIFDITDEYPKEYYTYRNENLELYLFPSGNFTDMYNLFDLLSTYPNVGVKFTLNKSNVFGKMSFYINPKVDDGNVRLVIDNWKILFWLKVKKSYYSQVKKILETPLKLN